MKDRVLLVGASGFIGSHCLRVLKAAGYEVYPTYNTHPPHAPRMQWQALDIFDEAAVGKLMADLRPQYMINCAWYVAHGLFWDATINADYVDATHNLYRKFSESGGARAIFLGTGAERVSNDASRGGDTAYARSKREAGSMLEKTRLAGAGVSYLWAHLYALYGPGEPLERFVPYVISSYFEGKAPIVQNPHLHYNFTYAGNVALMLVDQLKGNLEGQAACVTDDTLSLADMASYIHESFFPDGPAPFIQEKNAAPMVFAPVAGERCVEFSHLQLLSRYDALRDYIARIKDNAHGM